MGCPPSSGCSSVFFGLMCLRLVPVRAGAGHRVCLSPVRLAPSRQDRLGELRLSGMPSPRWTAVATQDRGEELFRDRRGPGPPGTGGKLPCRRLRCSGTDCAGDPRATEFAPAQREDELRVWNGQSFILTVFSSVTPAHAQNQGIHIHPVGPAPKSSPSGREPKPGQHRSQDARS